MRFLRYAVFLIPIAILVAWFYGIRGLSLRGVAAVVILVAMAFGALYVAGSNRVFSGPYVPAHLEGGRVVPGAPR